MELDHPFHYHNLTFILRSEKKSEMELHHPFHPHKLTFILRNEKKESDGEKNTCEVCTQEILGSSYGCRGCSFYLHKICAELPQHYQRTVRRRGDEKEHNLDLCRCDLDNCIECRELFVNSYIYRCRDSDCFYINVCVFCASREQIVDLNCHAHGLSPMLTSTMVSCDACHTKHEGHSYMCLKCRFWIHEDCASLPIIIKLREHPHPLILSHSDSSPIRYSLGEFSCGICKQRLNQKAWLYHCKPCRFYVHPSCPAANIGCEIVENFGEADEESSMSLPKDEETDHLFLKFVKQLGQGDNGEIELNETELIKKFGYELTLKSEEEGLSTNKKCIACPFPISNDPFYSSCSDHHDDIFLHKWCAELPSELRHPGHPHKLFLLGERKNLRCSNCQCASGGFRFRCQVCPIYCLDVRCASLPTFIKHQVHKQHPLYLSEHCLPWSQHCVACNRDIDEFSFGCSVCNVNLHYTCALLPLEYKHRYDKHSFTLNYHSIKDDEEYYCEICEDDIDPMLWFYDCKECRQSVCVRCMWEDKKPFPHLPNWVRTYVYETHPHPLQLVSHAGGNRCGLCRNYIFEIFSYRCESEDCKGKEFHRKCIK